MSFPVLVWALKSLDLLKCSFFPPVRPFRLSSLVRMEAGGLATVADYWYELLKLLLTGAGKFISIWMRLIINLLNCMLLFDVPGLWQLGTRSVFPRAVISKRRSKGLCSALLHCSNPMIVVRWAGLVTHQCSGSDISCCLQPSGKGRRLPEVYCIVSRLGCFDLFSKVERIHMFIIALTLAAHTWSPTLIKTYKTAPPTVPTEPHPACIWSARHRILQFWLHYKAAANVVMPVVKVPHTET